VDVYGKIAKPFWDDKPVAIVNGGPSLLGFDFEQLRGAHVVAVKGRIFDIPWADAGFGLDTPRFIEWRDKLSDVQCRVYWAVPEDQLANTGPSPSKNITFLRRLDGQSVSEDPGSIYSGGTSGFGAMQVCIHKRARSIVLFGFDYDGSSHATETGPHNQKRREQDAVNWLRWAEHFRVYVEPLQAHGINVVNACPQSSIPCFQKVTLEDGVSMLRV
jgi:hypothetical protein